MNPVSEKDTAVSVLNIIKSLVNYQHVSFQMKMNGLMTGQLKSLFRHINKNNFIIKKVKAIKNYVLLSA
jgi:hypothetical protein